jgi:two-component system alkaline phosphatase synthesis response regulator PhoP
MSGMSAPHSILIVEDDASTAESLELYLRNDGFEVTIASDGVSGLAEARSGRHALVLLDLMLPGMYGMDVCRNLRAQSTVPVIMLTARTLEDDQVRGLDLGADDYITKPFSPRQVVARIRSVLRRQSLESSAPLSSGVLVVDPGAARATVEGRDVHLTPTELRILHLLMRTAGRVLTRSGILDYAFDSDFDGSDRTVDVHVKNMRRKLGAAGSSIETVFGIGYRFRTPG